MSKPPSLIFDIDNTICTTQNGDYPNSVPIPSIVELIRLRKNEGFYIVLFTSRNMRSYDGSIGKINKFTVPVLVDWLFKHEIPYDELIVGKPWPGPDGYYIDDRSIRPSEFLSLSHKQILSLLNANN